MKKQTFINILLAQKENTKKSTRRDIIDMLISMIEYHIADEVQIAKIDTCYNNHVRVVDGKEVLINGTGGVNLGAVMEVITRAYFTNNKNLKKSTTHGYDVKSHGEKYEVKFSTCDAYAKPVYEKGEQITAYLIMTYSKSQGGIVFKVPYSERAKIVVNNQGRPTTNQLARFIDQQLTHDIFGVVGY